MDKIGLFDFTTNFCVDKTDLREHPAFDRDYPIYMVNRVLSMSPKTCHLAMFMDGKRDIPKRQHFAFLQNEIDRERIYFNYVKAESEIPIKHFNWIREYFECNVSRALEYIRLMSEKQLDTILELYKIREANEKPKRKKVKVKS
jgi:hypothetical protein